MAEPPQHEYSSWIVVAAVIFLCWSCIFAAIRSWAKLRRSIAWALYDSVFLAGFLLALAQCVAVFIAVHNGLGKMPRDESPGIELRAEKAMYASQILYLSSIGVSKLSSILFLSTLARDDTQTRVCHALTALVASWLLASVFVIALRGNLSAPWLGLYDACFKRWVGIESAGLALEIVMWCTAFALCWGLNMPLCKRLKIVGIFGFRVFLVPLVAARLYFLHQAHSLSDVQAVTIAQIFTQAAMQYSIMAECTTCFKPFLHPFHTSYGWSQSGYGDGLGSVANNPKRDPYASSTSTSRRGSHRDTEVMFPARAKSKRQSVLRDESEALRLRPDNVSYSTKIGRTVESRETSGEDDIALLWTTQRKGRIHQTTTVSVAHDDAPAIARS